MYNVGANSNRFFAHLSVYFSYSMTVLICVFIISLRFAKSDDYLGEVSLKRSSMLKDRLKCPVHTYNKTCCNVDEFRCNSGDCIPFDKVCSSPAVKLKYLSFGDQMFSQCPDGSDEFGCSYKPCASRSSKCFGSCVDLPGNRSRCLCDKGYVTEASSFDQKCMDIDECKLGFDWCSQGCVNLKGSFTCKCKEGFDGDPKGYPGTCKAKDKKIIILFDSYPWIYGQNSDSSEPTQEMVPSGKLDGVDIDPMTDIIYWTYRYRLKRSYIPGAKGKKVTVGHPQIVPLPRKMRRLYTRGSGFSLDWIGENIYWLTLNGRDFENRAVIVTKLDGRYKKTLMNGVWHATSLLVHPEKGVMYWTWLRTKDDSGISTAWMNGRYRKTLLRLPGQDPIALTVDNQSDGRIYWIDAVTNTIYYTVHDFATSLNQLLVSVCKPFKVISIDNLCSPQSLSIFENYLYWLDGNCDVLFRRDKFGRGKTVALKIDISNSSFLKIHHRTAVKSKMKVRLNGLGSCSHLTLIRPNGFDCVCPDDLDFDRLYSETLCDHIKRRPLLEPMRCDCTDKNVVCNSASPFSACYCSDHCVNYTVVDEIDSQIFHSFVLPDYRVIVSIIPLLLVLTIVGMFIFITYPLNSGIPLEFEKL